MAEQSRLENAVARLALAGHPDKERTALMVEITGTSPVMTASFPVNSGYAECPRELSKQSLNSVVRLRPD